LFITCNYISIIRDTQAQDAISFAASSSSACDRETLSVEAKRLISNPDAIVRNLMVARSRSDTHGDNDSVEEISTPCIVFKKQMFRGRELDADERHVISNSIGNAPVIWYRSMIRPGVDPYLAKVRVDDYWEVMHPIASSVMPLGPRRNVAIIRVVGIVQHGAQAYIQPLWLQRISSRPAELTKCFKYQLAMRFARFPKLIGEHRLCKKVHVHATGDMLLHNSFFLK